MSKRKACISLFTGLGGFDIGMERAGLDVRIMQEINKAAAWTLRMNGKAVIEGDICQLIKEDPKCKFLLNHLPNGDVFVVFGGPPCQPFSYHGKKLGFDDERARTYEAFVSVVKAVKPRFFVMETVRGFLSKPGALDFILGSFNRIGYKTAYGVANAADYGAPQIRKRLLVIGSRDGEDVSIPEPTHAQYVTLRETLAGLKDDGAGAKFTPRTLDLMRHVPEGGNWRSLPKRLQKKALGGCQGGGLTGVCRRLSWSKPSPTVMCCPTQRTTLFAHPTENRPLTVREYARIQGIPDSYSIKGSIPDQYRQIGNAVPVPLGEAIGRMLINIGG